jgi:hypothetical protein
MLLGATASTQGPLSCFDSGRVHPNLFFQQAYAFTYAGTDTFEVLSISSNGVAILYRYTIKIVDVDSKKKGRADLRP